MSGVFATIVVILVLWMLLCLWCGFKSRYFLFGGVLVGTIALNMVWMIVALDAHPLEKHALFAQVSLLFYGVSTFGIGWMFGRLRQRWIESRVDDAVD